MLIGIVVLQVVVLVAVIVVLLRKPVGAELDPRLAQLPEQIARLDGRADAVRESLVQMRGDIADEGRRTREANAAEFGGLRTEFGALRTEIAGNITSIGQTLKGDLGSFREDNSASAEKLRGDVEQKMRTISQGFSDFKNEVGAKQGQLDESLNRKLIELMGSNAAHLEKLRGAVEERLSKLNEDNTKKLEEMRATVDEKLHATLQTRLTESFGQVTDQLTRVHAGLGEMTKLSAGVDDLSRIFTNVKSRGTIGEVMLETLLKQMLAPNQFEKNVKPKPGSLEVVEFAVKLPTPTGETFLPIDSKFPREAWERLESAYEQGLDVVSARRALETAIRNEGKKICEKYISPPHTTSFAIMFLPTEGLYAEVMRSDGLQSDIQQNCHVTIAGPSTLSAILSSFQMGFHMLQLQQKGDEVWKVLANARKEFGTFEKLMDKMTDDVGKVQGTIDKLGVRTRAINRTLRDVSLEESGPGGLPSGGQSAFDGLLPMLAASESEE
ncbi:MAG TPA: DNA recombination protein RmuC [Acidobacteriaceae bacterium]|nr:DNA recombination protein RmuC [Acidobacteriaceae bacterium]